MKLKDKLKKRLELLEIDQRANQAVAALLDELVHEYQVHNFETILFLEELVDTDKKFEKVSKKYLPDGFRQRCIDALMEKKSRKNGV